MLFKCLTQKCLAPQAPNTYIGALTHVAPYFDVRAAFFGLAKPTVDDIKGSEGVNDWI